jgi:hypothetical protein
LGTAGAATCVEFGADTGALVLTLSRDCSKCVVENQSALAKHERAVDYYTRGRRNCYVVLSARR